MHLSFGHVYGSRPWTFEASISLPFESIMRIPGWTLPSDSSQAAGAAYLAEHVWHSGNLGIVESHGVQIYASQDMRSGINVAELVRSQSILASLLAVDPRGGVYNQEVDLRTDTRHSFKYFFVNQSGGGSCVCFALQMMVASLKDKVDMDKVRAHSPDGTCGTEIIGLVVYKVCTVKFQIALKFSNGNLHKKQS